MSDDPSGSELSAAGAPPEWFKAALDSMIDLVGIRRAMRDDAGAIVDFEIVYTNAPSHGAVEVAEDRPVGSRLTDLDPATRELVARYAEVVETGEPLSISDYRFEHVVDGATVVRWYAVQVTKFGDGVIIVSRDVTGLEEERRQIEDLNRQLGAAQRLAHVGFFTVDPATDAIWFSDELRAIFGIEPDVVLPSRDELVRDAFEPSERDVIDAAQRQLETTGTALAFEASVHRPDSTRRDLLIHLEIGEGESGGPGGDPLILGTAQDITALRSIERDRDRAERDLEGQRALIDQFQAATLAPVPSIPGIRLESAYYPAARHERFGGDWYDVFSVDDESVMLVVGDVAGHGIEAVAAMAQLRNVLRAYAFEARDPAAALDRLDAFARASDVDEFATVCCARYDLRRRVLTWAHAGHPPPVLATVSGSVLLERPGRPPIGVDFPRPTPQHEVAVAPGAAVVLYTDGLVEVRGASIDEGLERLAEEAAVLVGRAGPMCRRLRDALVADRSDDDICLLTMRTDAVEPVDLDLTAEPVATAPPVGAGTDADGRPRAVR